jgi:hypothetical protein
MNIALEQTKEYVDGQLLQTYGDAFIRGNNGMRLFAMPHEASSNICLVMYISADS